MAARVWMRLPLLVLLVELRAVRLVLETRL